MLRSLRPLDPKGLAVIDDIAYIGVSEWGDRVARQTSNSELAAFDLVEQTLLWRRPLETRGLLNVVSAPHLAYSSTYQAISTRTPTPSLMGGFFTSVDFDYISPAIEPNIPRKYWNSDPRLIAYAIKKPISFIDNEFEVPESLPTDNSQRRCLADYRRAWHDIRTRGFDYVHLQKSVFYKLPFRFDAEKLREELSQVWPQQHALSLSLSLSLSLTLSCHAMTNESR